jgi:hypothetical protein
LSPNSTANITVVASTSDPGGPGNILYATSTIYRTSLGSNCTANNLNCYRIPSSSCVFGGSSSTVTCTANLWYFAQSTNDPSSSYPADSWTSAITLTDGGGYAATATSSQANVNVLTAINVATSSINYGLVMPNANTGATNQMTTVQNVGNSSTSLRLSGTAFVKGINSFATSSQSFATSSFNYNNAGSSTALTGSAVTVSGFFLIGPISTATVQSTIFWGEGVPAGNPTGTYNATTFNVQYFADATDGSSTFNGQTWMATVLYRTPDNTTGTADSTSGQTMKTTNAIQITTSSINYGPILANSNSAGIDQITTTTNVGNCTATLSLYYSPQLGSTTQGFATSSFNYNNAGSSTALTGSAVAVSGFMLALPTSTATVAGPIYWGVSVPSNVATGTYSGTNVFQAGWHP